MDALSRRATGSSGPVTPSEAAEVAVSAPAAAVAVEYVVAVAVAYVAVAVPVVVEQSEVKAPGSPLNPKDDHAA